MVFKYKGYILQQVDKCNNHYMVLQKDGRRVMRVSFSGGVMTEEDARRIIDGYINLSQKKFDIVEDCLKWLII